MKQGQVAVDNLNTEQLKFVVNVLADLMDKLIQDEIDRDENGDPLPFAQQEFELTQRAMRILNYK